MTRPVLLSCMLGVALGAPALWWSGQRALEAHATARRARSALVELVGRGRELQRLRAMAPRTAAPAPDASAGLTERAADALAAGGLPGSALESVAPGAETPIPGPDGGPHARRKRATLTLSAATLPQVGSFLEAWRTAEPAWTVTGVDLSPASRERSAAAGGDLPLRVVIGLESVVLEPPGESR